MRSLDSNEGNPELHSVLKPLKWKNLGRFGQSELVIDTESALRGQSYIVNSNFMQQQLNIYQFRKDNPQFIITVHSIDIQTQSIQPTVNKQTKVITERIPFRLTDLGNVGYAEGLYIIECALKGANLIKNQYFILNKESEEKERKYIHYTDEMIGFTEKGETKIWVNKHIALNSPLFRELKDPTSNNNNKKTQPNSQIVNSSSIQPEQVKQLMALIQSKMSGNKFINYLEVKESQKEDLISFQNCIDFILRMRAIEEGESSTIRNIILPSMVLQESTGQQPDQTGFSYMTGNNNNGAVDSIKENINQQQIKCPYNYNYGSEQYYNTITERLNKSKKIAESNRSTIPEPHLNKSKSDTSNTLNFQKSYHTTSTLGQNLNKYAVPPKPPRKSSKSGPKERVFLQEKNMYTTTNNNEVTMPNKQLKSVTEPTQICNQFNHQFSIQNNSNSTELQNMYNLPPQVSSQNQTLAFPKQYISPQTSQPSLNIRILEAKNPQINNTSPEIADLIFDDNNQNKVANSAAESFSIKTLTTNTTNNDNVNNKNIQIDKLIDEKLNHIQTQKVDVSTKYNQIPTTPPQQNQVFSTPSFTNTDKNKHDHQLEMETCEIQLDTKIDNNTDQQGKNYPFTQQKQTKMPINQEENFNKLSKTAIDLNNNITNNLSLSMCNPQIVRNTIRPNNIFLPQIEPLNLNNKKSLSTGNDARPSITFCTKVGQNPLNPIESKRSSSFTNTTNITNNTNNTNNEPNPPPSYNYGNEDHNPNYIMKLPTQKSINRTPINQKKFPQSNNINIMNFNIQNRKNNQYINKSKTPTPINPHHPYPNLSTYQIHQQQPIQNFPNTNKNYITPNPPPKPISQPPIINHINNFTTSPITNKNTIPDKYSQKTNNINPKMQNNAYFSQLYNRYYYQDHNVYQEQPYKPSPKTQKVNVIFSHKLINDTNNYQDKSINHTSNNNGIVELTQSSIRSTGTIPINNNNNINQFNLNNRWISNTQQSFKKPHSVNRKDITNDPPPYSQQPQMDRKQNPKIQQEFKKHQIYCIDNNTNNKNTHSPNTTYDSNQQNFNKMGNVSINDNNMYNDNLVSKQANFGQPNRDCNSEFILNGNILEI